AEEQQFWEYDGRIGILSLTEYNNSLAMWNYYACSGRGFCVGLDTQILFSFVGGGGKVDYPCDGLPTIHGTDSYLVERWKKTFNKETKWEFEQEYRVSVFNPNGLRMEERKVKLPAECLREIIFGWCMPQKEKLKMVKICKTQNYNVNYFQAISGGDPVRIEPLNFL